MSSLAFDVRYALRSLAKTPGFTAAVIVTLGLGIGANTAIFSVVHGVLLKSLPYREPARLVRIGHAKAGGSALGATFSPQDFEDLEREHPALESVAAYQFVPGLTGMNLVGDGEPLRLSACYVSTKFFEILGVAPRAGRALRPEENTPGRDQVLLLSAGLWARRFGNDPAIIGRVVNVDGKPFTVAGVMPRSFEFPSAGVDVWAPVSLLGEDSVPHRRDVRWLDAIGRLAQGQDVATARTAVSGLFLRLEKQFPESNEGFGKALVVPLETSLVGDVRTPLVVLLGAVALVLLIACANVANLLLARGAGRSREIAIRTALGARPGRIVRQLLTESVLLALAAGVAGLAAASWGVDGLLALIGDHLPRAGEVRPDAAVGGFALALSIATGIGFGLFPAFAATRRDLPSALEAGGRGAVGGGRRVRAGLVIAETVLAVLLLTGASLLAKSFWRLVHVDTGIRPERVLALSITTPSPAPYDEKRETVYRDEILARVAALPGVLSAGASKTLPLSGGGELYSYVIEGRPGLAGNLRPESGTFIVTPGYFAALGIPVLRGRGFNQRDLDTRVRVLLVNDVLGRQVWPGEDPVGKFLRIGPRARFQVIGVAGNVRHEGPRTRAAGAVYVPISFFPRSTLKIFIRTAGDPLALAPAVRAAIRALHPDQPISGVAPLTLLVSETVSQPRFYASVLSAFAALALLLAGIGLYAVIAHGVERRTREIGVRIALGAGARDVLGMVVREGLALACLGVATGLACSFAATRLLGSLLFGVSPTDPVVFGAVALFLLGVGVSASYVPARRAASIDPVVALRQE